MPVFDLNKTTSQLLKTCQRVSNSILLSEGRAQQSIAAGKAVLLHVELPEAWPRTTGIYDLSSFLSTLSLFDKPGIQFDDDAMVIKEKKSRIKYRYSNPSTIQTASEKDLSKLHHTNPAVQFVLPGDVLSQLKKTCALLSLSDVAIAASKGNVTVRATDLKNASAHAFEHDVEAVTAGDPSFVREMPFKKEHIDMLLDGDYTVSVSTWPWAHFAHKTEPVSYYVVVKVK